MNRLEELDRAQRDLDRQKCQVIGHDTFTVMSGGLGTGGAPHRVICDRCGESWRVVSDGYSESPSRETSRMNGR